MLLAVHGYGDGPPVGAVGAAAGPPGPAWRCLGPHSKKSSAVNEQRVNTADGEVAKPNLLADRDGSTVPLEEWHVHAPNEDGGEGA